MAETHLGMDYASAVSAGDAQRDAVNGVRNPAHDEANEEWSDSVQGNRGGSNGPNKYLDGESEAWLRDLFDETDTAAAEGMARKEHEVALGRGKANMEARGGMAGMGLAGGQIAMNADLERQSADALAASILGIQEGARAEDLKRGTIAADFLDRGVGRRLEGEQIAKDDAMMLAVLAEMGLEAQRDEDGNITGFGEVDDTPDTSNGMPDEHKDYLDNLSDGGSTWDYSIFDEDAGAGSQQEPYNMPLGQKDELEEQGFEFTAKTVKTSPWAEVTMYVDQYGNHWFFDDDPGKI